MSGLAAAAAITMLFACGSEPPRIDGVTPLIGVEGERTEVTVTGGGFFWRYDAFGNQLSGEMRVLVGQTPLEELAWQDAGTLTGVVPETLMADFYDVTVEVPAGCAVREDGFVVRPAGLVE